MCRKHRMTWWMYFPQGAFKHLLPGCVCFLYWVHEMTKALKRNELDICSILLHGVCYINDKSFREQRYYFIKEKGHLACWRQDWADKAPRLASPPCSLLPGMTAWHVRTCGFQKQQKAGWHARISGSPRTHGSWCVSQPSDCVMKKHAYSSVTWFENQ